MSGRDDPFHRLELWFSRDLRWSDRAALLRLYGITHATGLEEQKAFRKILEDAAYAIALASSINQPESAP